MLPARERLAGIAVADAIAVLDAVGVQRAHVVGLSMGGFATLHLLMRHPDRVRSAVVGYGAWHRRDPRSLSASTTGIR